jgi:hypothetical protein
MAQPTNIGACPHGVENDICWACTAQKEKDMADEKDKQAGTRTEMKDGVFRRTTIIEEGSAGPPEPTKPYKLREGMRHNHQGRAMQAGESVELTEAQARAWRDKFEPEDDSEFEVKTSEDQQARRAGTSPQGMKKTADDLKQGLEDAEAGEGRDEQETEAKQGLPVPQPPQAVRPRALGRDPNSPPADPSALDPAKQGQQSNEQRQLIDRNLTPPPAAVPSAPAAATTGEAGADPTRRTASATGSAAGTSGTGRRGRDAGPLRPDADPSKGSSDRLS